MARQVNRLTSRGLAALLERANRGELGPEDDYGVHGDGNGLYLVVKPNGALKWTFIYRWDGKRQETGLGSARTVGLAAARLAATKVRVHRTCRQT